MKIDWDILRQEILWYIIYALMFCKWTTWKNTLIPGRMQNQTCPLNLYSTYCWTNYELLDPRRCDSVPVSLAMVILWSRSWSLWSRKSWRRCAVNSPAWWIRWVLIALYPCRVRSQMAMPRSSCIVIGRWSELKPLSNRWIIVTVAMVGRRSRLTYMWSIHELPRLYVGGI